MRECSAAMLPFRTGRFGYAAERSRGKDTPSGHWEMMGLPVEFDWGYFPDTQPCFPRELTEALIRRGGIGGILGNRHASGTQIVAEPARSICAPYPIVYTSGDSVLQTRRARAALRADVHSFPGQVARELVDEYRIAVIIARPFVTSLGGGFIRTGTGATRRRRMARPCSTARRTPHGEVIVSARLRAIFSPIAA